MKKCDADQVSAMVEAVKAGCSYSKVARRLDCDPGTVRNYCLLAGIRSMGRRVPPEKINSAVNRVRDGNSYLSAAKLAGLNMATVRKCCLARGVKSQFQSHQRGRRNSALWPTMSLDGITFKQSPEWEKLLAEQRELQERLEKLEKNGEWREGWFSAAALERRKEFSEVRKRLASLDETMGKTGHRFFKIIKVKPLEEEDVEG